MVVLGFVVVVVEGSSKRRVWMSLKEEHEK